MFLNAYRAFDGQIGALVVENSDTITVIKRLIAELQNLDDSELCCYQLINHPEWKNILGGIFRLIGSDNERLSGNAAYIVGTICSYEVCRSRIVDWLVNNADNIIAKTLCNLNELMAKEDENIVVNASGTIATLADSVEGCMWLLRQFDLDDTIDLMCVMLQSRNDFLSSHASLVIARLTVVEEGCARLLNQRDCKTKFLHFIQALTSRNPDCKQNVAFTLARLFNLESGQRNLLSMKQSSEMINRLVKLLSSLHVSSKNGSCFALGSLATRKQGNRRLTSHKNTDAMLVTIVKMLRDDNKESVLFSIFFFKSLVSHEDGLLFLRDHKPVKEMLITVSRSNLPKKVFNDLKFVLGQIEDLPKLDGADINVVDARTVTISWNAYLPQNNFPVSYHVYQDSVAVIDTSEAFCRISSLKPVTCYSFTVCASLAGATGPRSDPVSIRTPECVPSPPVNLRIVSRTTSQLKVYWKEPFESNGLLLGYELSLIGKSLHVSLKICNYLFTHLQPDTEYKIEVCAVTSKGQGECACLVARTESLGAFAPSLPTIHVQGRSGMFIEWHAPKRALGRLNYYELKMNSNVIYRGIERNHTIHGVNRNVEHSFTVSAWTSEGCCESKPVFHRIKSDSKRRHSLRP